MWAVRAELLVRDCYPVALVAAISRTESLAGVSSISELVVQNVTFIAIREAVIVAERGFDVLGMMQMIAG
jgi:hypothetical protein